MLFFLSHLLWWKPTAVSWGLSHSLWRASDEQELKPPTHSQPRTEASWQPHQQAWKWIPQSQMTAAQADVLTTTSWETLSHPDPRKPAEIIMVCCFKLPSVRAVCYPGRDAQWVQGSPCGREETCHEREKQGYMRRGQHPQPFNPKTASESSGREDPSIESF